MEEALIRLITEYGYPILFVWSMMEGEIGLVMAGLLSHTGHMNLFLAIFVAGVGGFLGDQFWFYVGRYNKKYTLEYFRSQRRKVALAHLLLRKYGWPIIFIQRYLYGLRTIIPMAIGTTRYDKKKFAFINLISALIWAAITIVLTYFLGEPILNAIKYIKSHWYFAFVLLAVILGTFYYYLNKASKPKTRRVETNENIVQK
ncbi:MAG: DedA family protein [Campylobacteraceae bacterium]|jgi:membrane protein DedA with SNARE-associated domain|nr:DedA family protein [Campylobacteraceae bacterium]